MRAFRSWKVIAVVGLLAAPEALVGSTTTLGAVAELVARGVALLGAGWIVCSFWNTRASREFPWVFSAAVLAMGAWIGALWNIGLYHALMYAMFGVPLGSVVAVAALDVRERRVRRGSLLGLVLAMAFASVAFFPSGAVAWGLGMWGFYLFIGLDSGICYMGYRLGQHVQLRAPSAA
jgi:hypothetical protein